MTEGQVTVFIVDDDPPVAQALARLAEASGYASKMFDSAGSFLLEHDPEEPGCLLLDLSMPEIDGLQLQTALLHEGIDRPIIFITGQNDVQKSVAAMKGGAVDFLIKPVDAAQLLPAIAQATARDAQRRRARHEVSSIAARAALLTPREREVMEHVIAGRLNKQIAGDLGTVEKTVKVHRGRMMAKMGVRSVAELVRITEHIGAWPQQSGRALG
jgi:FixJ family two-component response regulator